MTIGQEILAALETAQVERMPSLMPKVIDFKNEFVSLPLNSVEVVAAYALWDGCTDIMPAELQAQVSRSVEAYMAKKATKSIAALYKKLERD